MSRSTTRPAAARRAPTPTAAVPNTATTGGRLIETIFDDGESMKTEYDNAGRKTADIDPMNRRTEYRYDTLGRLTHVILAAGTPNATVTTYTYDARGNKLTQTDAEGRTTR